MDRLDDTDERILAELAEHARATFAEIGHKVSLSAPAVKRRVDRMLESGVIKGFTTVVDRNALGWNTEAYVQIFCHGRIAPDQLRAAWVNIPEVVSAATVTGTSDAILHVLAHDMRHLRPPSSASGPALTSNAAKAPSCCQTSSTACRPSVPRQC